MKRMIGVATLVTMLSACATGPAPAPVYEAATSLNSPGFITAPAGQKQLGRDAEAGEPLEHQAIAGHQRQPMRAERQRERVIDPSES